MAIKQNDAQTQQALERKETTKLTLRVLSVAETRTIAAGQAHTGVNPEVWAIKPTAE